MPFLVVALADSDCEQLRSGWLAQPANALSSAAFAAVGLWLLWRFSGRGWRPGHLALGALALVGVGVGSIAYHGPQPSWAHVAHDVSAFVLAAVVAAETIWLFARTGTRPVIVDAWRATAPWAVFAVVAYGAGRSGSPLCRPTSLWQFHAAWHVVCALTIGALLTRSTRRNHIARAEAPVGG
jgi:hypothetical protein